MADYYEWIKAFHIIAIVLWMAGMFYLPKIFVYHCKVGKDDQIYQNFLMMEKNIIKYIINPSMIVSIVLGLILAYIYGFGNLGTSFYIKMCTVVFFLVLHVVFIRSYKSFLNGSNCYSYAFYKAINIAVVFLMAIAIVMVVVKPLP